MIQQIIAEEEEEECMIEDTVESVENDDNKNLNMDLENNPESN